MSCVSGWLVALHVEGEVVGPREGSLAEVALERLETGVLSEVAGQLVRPSKLPRAPFPTALVGFFSCVCPLVSLEVRTLGVHFVAARHVAAVDFPPPQAVCVLPVDLFPPMKGDGGGGASACRLGPRLSATGRVWR